MVAKHCQYDDDDHDDGLSVCTINSIITIKTTNVRFPNMNEYIKRSLLVYDYVKELDINSFKRLRNEAHANANANANANLDIRYHTRAIKHNHSVYFDKVSDADVCSYIFEAIRAQSINDDASRSSSLWNLDNGEEGSDISMSLKSGQFDDNCTATYYGSIASISTIEDSIGTIEDSIGTIEYSIGSKDCVRSLGNGHNGGNVNSGPNNPLIPSNIDLQQRQVSIIRG